MFKNKKLILRSILFVLILIIIPGSAYATAIDKFSDAITTVGSDDLKTEGGKIVGIIQVVGTMVAVGMLGILGIKYLLGSAEQKAEYKKSMIPYVIGAILIFGFSNITQFIYEWASKI